MVSSLLVSSLEVTMAKDKKATPSGPPWSPSLEEGWKPMEHGNLLVKEGSVLDFSYLVEDGPAGKHGYAIVNEAGQLVFENKPNDPLRFFSAADPMEWWTPTGKEEVAEYAKQVRLAGYNCFRNHFLDLMLMINTTENLVVNPEQLDRWDYLSAELKKQGVYLYIDLISSWYAFHANKVRGFAWDPQARAFNLSGRIYWDPAAREHWEKAVRFLLNHVNPYTGVALKDEPQVIVMQFRNEAGLHFLLEHGNRDKMQEKGLIAPYRQWLEKRYGTIEKLNTAWGRKYASFSDIPWPELTGTSPQAADTQRFIVDIETETLHWMRDIVKSTGTRALWVDFNAGNQNALNLTRSAQPVVDTHVYHDHPTTYVSKGSSMPNVSSVGQGFPFVTWANEVRQLDRPFMVSEWGYPYWNQWRYEAGLSMPAYAAFQDWQLLNHAFEGVKIKMESAPRPFKIGFDPPGRLSERMAAFLYARGDVSPGKHSIVMKLDPEGIFNRLGGQAYLPSQIRRLTLLVRTGIQIIDFPQALPGGKIETNAAMVIGPDKGTMIWEDKREVPTGNETSLIDALRERGFLGANNPTSAATGIYQTDTGELTLNMKQRTMQVNTPKSQAAALPEGSEEARLSDTSILNEGNSGSFFIGAVDNLPIKESKRLLIMAVGDAVNTGAVFADKSRQVLDTLGTFPVLVKPIKAKITLWRSVPKGHKARLWPLAYNGDRLMEVPVQTFPDRIEAALDSVAQGNPVFQYELILEPSAP